LTIKFTQHTAAPPLAFSFQPSALSKTTTRLRKLYGPRSCSSRANAYTSAPQQVFSQALIKIYSLVDCPIYSVVKYRPRGTSYQPSAKASSTTRLGGLGFY
jgi:hypothetical protein